MDEVLLDQAKPLREKQQVGGDRMDSWLRTWALESDFEGFNSGPTTC